LEAMAGRLTVTPTWVAVAGEIVTPPVREAIRAAWGIEASEFWGVSEGTYAFPCGVGEGFHIADDLVILEPVDADGHAVPYGQPAERLLLTSLYNLDQPLIRYDLADAVTITDEPCACGCAHRRITGVNGRIDGTFDYDGGRQVTVYVPPDPPVAIVFAGGLTEGRSATMGRAAGGSPKTA